MIIFQLPAFEVSEGMALCNESKFVLPEVWPFHIISYDCPLAILAMTKLILPVVFFQFIQLWARGS